jgi:uncharacterized protein
MIRSIVTRLCDGTVGRRALAFLLICAVLGPWLAPGRLPAAAQVPVPPIQQTPTGPEGAWAGGYWLDGVWTFFQVEFAERRGRWSGTLRLPYASHAMSPGAVSLDAARFEEPTLGFEARLASGTLTFQADLTGNELNGHVLWEPGPGRAGEQPPAETGRFALWRIVLLSNDYAGYRDYVGDYRILPDEATFFVGMAGQQGALGRDNELYLSYGYRHIGLLPLGGDSFLTTTGHELIFERYHGEEVVGFIIEGDNALPWTLEGSYRQVAASADGTAQARAVKVGHYYTDEVRFYSGSARLAGTVLLPHGPGPHPAVVFAPGAGQETRERYRELAAAFAREGIASIIYDKLGSGASSGRWTTASLYDLVESSLEALRVLKPYHEIDHEAIGIWGLSHGGWVAPLAAIWSEEEVAFVITLSGAGMTPAEQSMYRWRNVLLDHGVTPRELDAGMKAARLQPDLHRLRLPGADGFFRGLDPDHYAVSVLERMQPPLLAIWGEKDRTVPPWTSAVRFEAALARAGNEDVTLRILAGAGHTMLLVEETEAAPDITNGPWVAYPPGYIDLMVDWILARTTEAGAPRDDATEGGGVEELPTGMLTPDPARAATERMPRTRLPWYGRPPMQFGALLLLAMLLLSGGIVWAVMAGRGLLARLRAQRVRWHALAPPWALLAAAVGVLLTTGVLVGLMVALSRFGLTEAAALLSYLRSPVVRGIAWLAPVTALGLVALTWWAWRRRSTPIAARIHLTAVAVAALAVLPLLGYWRVWG